MLRDHGTSLAIVEKREQKDFPLCIREGGITSAESREQKQCDRVRRTHSQRSDARGRNAFTFVKIGSRSRSLSRWSDIAFTKGFRVQEGGEAIGQEFGLRDRGASPAIAKCIIGHSI